ncbi:protein MMS22-like [Adelges cooleyi]|uniref:protein MMS22-like n=1 Tax=Adelges cooleyi TaxID=133065 RepID=UPI0021805771|nr:protein MMS22-like [Adelges cooleyi]
MALTPHYNMHLFTSEQIEENAQCIPCFDCKIRTNKYFIKTEQKFITLDADENVDDQSDSTTLFGHFFHKGQSIVYDLPVLFKMAKKHILSLSSVLRDQYKSFRSIDQNHKDTAYSETRKQIADFFLFLRDGFKKANCNDNYSWLLESYEDKIVLELENLCSSLGLFNNLSETVIQHALASSESKNNIYYHLYHCNLDVRWLQITVLLQFPKHISVLKHTVSYVLEDLVRLGRNRFIKLKPKELHSKSALLCECSYDLLFLIQQLIKEQQSSCNIDNFWQLLNSTFTKVEIVDCEELTFRLWFLNSLQGSAELALFDFKDCNLVTTLKDFLKLEPSEAQLKLAICLSENFVLSTYATEPIITLWEYFHKRLNSMFYSADTNLQNIACISKSGSELLIQMLNLFKTQISEAYENLNSYQLFQRLLGLHLKMITHNSKDWNQIKGRVFSKFSQSKLASFNEMGFYNFTTLFLTLAIMSSDTSQIALKYQHLINLITEQKLESSIRLTYWKGTVAFLILHSQRSITITPYGSALSEIVETTPKEYITIFVDGLREIFTYNESLTLGQHILFGTWVEKYLNTIKPSDDNEILQISLLILNKLKEAAKNYTMPLPKDNEEFMLYNALYKQMLPFLKTSCLAIDCHTIVADIGATFTALSSVVAFSDTKVMLFNYFVINQGISIKLLNRYLSIIIKENVPTTSIHGYNSLALIKAWLRSSMLITNWTYNETIIITQFVSTIKEIQELYENSSNNLVTSVDPFITFLDQLNMKYHQTQDLKSKQKLCEKVSDYFFSINIWVTNLIKQQKQNDEIYRLYMAIGYMLEKISPMIYVKSKPNTILQDLLDSMLLGVAVRSPNSKTHPSVVTALQTNIHRYLIGLFRLHPKTDQYINRCLREMIFIYLPKILMGTKSSDELPLIKFFENKPDSEIPERGLLLELIVTLFFSKRNRTPDSSVAQVLVFINKVINVYCDSNFVILSITHHTFARICSVMMFCEDANVCKRIANDILGTLIQVSESNSSNEIKDEILRSLDVLCQEHLAFSSKLVFDFFDNLIILSPNIVTCFLPKLIQNIEKVEWKRGIGSDFTLRKGLERIRTKLSHK